MTNNEVEYKAVFLGFDLAKVVGVESAIIQCNSQVVVGHINGDYEAKGEWMKEYLSMVKDKMSEGFSAKLNKSQGKRMSKQTIWPKLHFPGIQTSLVRYYLSSNIPLPLTK